MSGASSAGSRSPYSLCAGRGAPRLQSCCVWDSLLQKACLHSPAEGRSVNTMYRHALGQPCRRGVWYPARQGDGSSPYLPRDAISCSSSSGLPVVLSESGWVLEFREKPFLPTWDASKSRAMWISCQMPFCRRCSQACSGW